MFSIVSNGSGKKSTDPLRYSTVFIMYATEKLACKQGRRHKNFQGGGVTEKRTKNCKKRK